jgi:hypothetical protein
MVWTLIFQHLAIPVQKPRCRFDYPEFSLGCLFYLDLCYTITCNLRWQTSSSSPIRRTVSGCWMRSLTGQPHASNSKKLQGYPDHRQRESLKRQNHTAGSNRMGANIESPPAERPWSRRFVGRSRQHRGYSISGRRSSGSPSQSTNSGFATSKTPG